MVAPADHLDARDDLLGPQRAHDLGRAREAHVDLGGLRLRVRVPGVATGTFVNGRSTSSRPISTVARTLLDVSNVTRPGGRSIASCRVYLPGREAGDVEGVGARVLDHHDLALGAARAHRRRIGHGHALHHEARRRRARRSPTSTGTSRTMTVFPRQVDGRRIDLLDLQARAAPGSSRARTSTRVSLPPRRSTLDAADVVGVQVVERRARAAHRDAELRRDGRDRARGSARPPASSATTLSRSDRCASCEPCTSE